MRTRSLVLIGCFLAVLTPALALAGMLAAALAGCRSLPPSKPEALWTIEEARGAQVFHQACAKCHYPTTTKGLKGPRLAGHHQGQGHALRRAAHRRAAYLYDRSRAGNDARHATDRRPAQRPARLPALAMTDPASQRTRERRRASQPAESCSAARPGRHQPLHDGAGRRGHSGRSGRTALYAAVFSSLRPHSSPPASGCCCSFAGPGPWPWERSSCWWFTTSLSSRPSTSGPPWCRAC